MTPSINPSPATPLPPCLRNVDGPLFRRQRDLLLRLAIAQHGELGGKDKELIDGLINFTDAIADFLHDEHGVDCLLS